MKMRSFIIAPAAIRMAGKCAMLSLIVILPLTSLGFAGTKARKEVSGFLTGKDFLRFDKVMKQTYVMGVIDGMSGADLFGAHPKEMEWFNGCLTSIKSEEVLSIVVKYLSENPDAEHLGMSAIVWDALMEHCHKPSELKPSP